MESIKENRTVLKYRNNEDTQTFAEGDAVICFTGRKIYSGTIVAFGNYKESEEAGPQYSVYLDTSKDSKNRSCKIINIADIIYMCKLSENDWFGYPKTNEDLDRNNFINMIAALGHDKEKAEIIYGHMKELIKLYNIPLSLSLACAIREIDLNAEVRSTQELIDISNKLIEVISRIFQSVTEVVKEQQVPGVES